MYQHWFDNKTDTIFENGLMPKLSRYVISDDPNWESGHHVHEAETELIYVKTGVAKLTIDSSNYIAQAGDIVVIERGSLHAVASDSASPATTYTCAVYGFKIKGLDEGRVMQPNSCPVVSAVKNKDVIKSIFQEISMILPKQKNSIPSSVYDAFGYALTVIFYDNFKNAYRTDSGHIIKDVLVKDILVYLNNNYREKITLDRLAKKFRASVSYICHEFTKEYNISPINYVIRRRITEAKFSLTNTELCLNEISFRVGYDNVDHFTKLFIRHVGCSPSEYRKQFKSDLNNLEYITGCDENQGMLI
ncbi:AraC family transcriptional regulator [Brenneria goodwinii]|uniref:AraC family transcriptional regulator n=1 Tax=Brenneria goodwinii TaxID=1109412 RepID=A0A0G4JWH1_9GAMM|nr:AraC family transcriptional regulator [Brenneria goodwinii]ATA22792.1 AraC family transcriptional regulator [Brenneria goodwinii]MCG8158575.1 AraC family transcriptional regulator [Brenneria goodwinii]MCG8162996.1 AraC family transcriptional regulator [Brenneria goodwinii]MCG8167835.1 AraC family transcriptional regulator [Brenneria goodwinii]MCG8172419.1 AraC family transcriptional regulator [Brenneria goodwinii]